MSKEKFHSINVLGFRVAMVALVAMPILLIWALIDTTPAIQALLH